MVSADGVICYLYIQPAAISLPAMCCTLSLTPLVRELIRHMAFASADYSRESPESRISAVLLEQLGLMDIEKLHLPVPANARLRKIADALLADPGNRKTVLKWADHVALSERSLRRLIFTETGMTFGRWRQQFQLMVAMQELASGNTVQSVADKLGYESASAFTTMFKKIMRSPPKRYALRRDKDRIHSR